MGNASEMVTRRHANAMVESCGVEKTFSEGGMSDKKRTHVRAERMGFVFQAYNPIPATRSLAGLVGLSQTI